MVASIVKTVQIRVLATPDEDPTTATVALDRWMYIESCVVIITVSIPCIRSLFTIGRRKNGAVTSGRGSSCGRRARIRSDSTDLVLPEEDDDGGQYPGGCDC